MVVGDGSESVGAGGDGAGGDGGLGLVAGDGDLSAAGSAGRDSLAGELWWGSVLLSWVGVSVERERKSRSKIKAPYAGGGHFVTRIPLRVVLPMVATEDCADRREERREAQYTPRSGRCPRRAPVRQDTSVLVFHKKKHESTEISLAFCR